ncbi:MAG: FHA domain-containing protein [Gemmataceae bacterium]
MDASSSLPTRSEPAPPPGELVAQTGRDAGLRRPLRRPLTLLGAGGQCDIRLMGDGIVPLHAVILVTDEGLLLRDLSGAGLQVNDALVFERRLANGDRLALGEHRFSLELDTSPTSEGPSADAVLLDREREALRIQAAAVVAQQAALLEEESRLDQRARLLDTQETQLASHLDERQSLLDERETELTRQHEAFVAEVTAGRETIAQAAAQVQTHQAALVEEREEVRGLRQRLATLRRALWKRYRRLGADREAALQRRQAELVALEQQVKDERERVRAFQERINGELELGRQRQREEAQALAQEKLRLAVEAEEQRGQLGQARTELQRANSALTRERQQWTEQRQRLEKECQGLEQRVGHLRKQMEQLRREAAPYRPAAPVAVAAAPLSPALKAEAPAVPCDLRQAAGSLGDQRLLLAEQWRRMVAVQHQWQEERLVALTELDQATERLAVRERTLAVKETGLLAAQQELIQRRATFEAQQSRWTVERAWLQAQQAEAAATLEERERRLVGAQRELEAERESLARREQEGLAALEASRRRLEEARRQASQLWSECEQLRGELAEQERAWVAQLRALDQLCDEMAPQALHSPRWQAQLEKLTAREATRLANEARTLTGERQRLLTERAALDEEARLQAETEQVLNESRLTLARQVQQWELQRSQAETEDRRREDELRRCRTRQAIAEQHQRQLQHEIERFAADLLREESPRRVA